MHRNHCFAENYTLILAEQRCSWAPEESNTSCAWTLQRKCQEGAYLLYTQVLLVCVSLTWGSSPAVGRSTSRWCNPLHPVWMRWCRQRSQHSDGQTVQPGGWRDTTAHSKSEIIVVVIIVDTYVLYSFIPQKLSPLSSTCSQYILENIIFLNCAPVK